MTEYLLPYACCFRATTLHFKRFSGLNILLIGSNGAVTDKNSLHYYNPANPYAAPNEYMQAITAVGNVLAPYDSDNRFPVWAFVRWFCVPFFECFDVVGCELRSINCFFDGVGFELPQLSAGLTSNDQA